MITRNFDILYNLKSYKRKPVTREYVETSGEYMKMISMEFTDDADVEDQLDTIFDVCNTNIPIKIKQEIEKLCKKADLDKDSEIYEMLHTSMSVGDVILNTTDDIMYFCSPIGWTVIK